MAFWSRLPDAGMTNIPTLIISCSRSLVARVCCLGAGLDDLYLHSEYIYFKEYIYLRVDSFDFTCCPLL